MNQPATVSKEILDKLSTLNRNDPSFEFFFRSLLREIAKLRKVEPWEAYMLEGVLYSKAFDVEGSLRAHQTSLKFSNATIVAYANYAASMARVGQHEEMLKASEYVLSSNRLEEGIVRHAMAAAIFLGKIDKAAEIKEKCSSVCSNDNMELKALFDAERVLSSFFNKKESLSSLYKKVMDSARDISQRRKHSVMFCTIDAENDSSGEMLCITLGVDADGFTAGDMNDEIAEYLAELSTSENDWDRIIPYFIPATFEPSKPVCL